MKRSQADAKYKWDFSNLYKTEEDWKKDLNKVVELSKQYLPMQNNLNKKEVFYSYLELDNQIDKIINKLAIYLHLKDIDTTNQQFQILEGLLVNEFSKINIATSFIAPEIKKIGKEQVNKWLNEKDEYKVYLYGMNKFFKEAEHILDEHDEKLLSKVSRSRGAIGDMYDTLAYADKHDEKINYKGKEQDLTTTLYMEIIEDSDPIKDQQLRIDAAKLFTKNFADRKHSFSSIYEGILLNSFDTIKIRNYKTAIEASLNSDAVPLEIYLKLLEIGKKYIKPFKEYNELLKKSFKLNKYYSTDSSLKLVKEYTKTFTVEQAQELIKDALKILGKEYLDNLNIAWSNNHIDYYEDTNKRDGAYSSGGAGVDPIILMNWDDKLNSVTTLAHESGHSVHTLFADQNQPYPLSEYPIILAEVASTINEHILFDNMYSKSISKNEKIYLLQQRISDLIGTFYRQIQFAEFEYEAHKLVESEQPLTADILAKLFSDIQLKYGYDIFDKVSDKYGYGWPRISHFFHSPFYVYKYAVDVVASFKLYNDIKNGNINTTLNFLKAGGHKDPLEIMKDVGIDFNLEETYLPLIKGIENYIEELKKLLNNN